MLITYEKNNIIDKGGMQLWQNLHISIRKDYELTRCAQVMWKAL